MTIQPSTNIRKVSGITPKQLENIENFLQGAVYSWVKNKPKKKFAARDLMGGDNFNWNGTPLQCLYNYQESLGKSHESAIKGAGISLGWILKSVLEKDKRKFKRIYGDRVAHYLWIK